MSCITPSNHGAHYEKNEIDLLIAAIYELTGFDFSNYNRSHLVRRLKLRLILEGLADFTSLLTAIHQDVLLLQKVLNDLSIQVTSMFRDPLFFLEFRRNVVPLLKELPEVNIWHAGCSTGEEAYSMAILLQEEGLLEKSRIYATDMNEDALAKAKAGMFPLERRNNYANNYMLAGGSSDFSQYFDTDDHNAFFQSSLMSSIFFDQHNLAIDNSFQEFHVIFCRNVCIYFNGELQHRVYKLFHESLHEEGVLCLGSQESLITTQNRGYFKEIDPNYKIYKKKSSGSSISGY